MEKIASDFLERHLMNPKYGEVYIGYTSFTRRNIVTSNSGIWLGYRNGEPFFDMRFRFSYPREKFTQDVWTPFKSVTFLCDKIHSFTKSPPLVLISSRKAVKFIQDQAYKWMSISEKEKAKMFFWLDTLMPQIEAYSAVTPPFSILREMMLEENNKVADLVANKKLYDYGQWNEFLTEGQDSSSIVLPDSSG